METKVTKTIRVSEKGYEALNKIASFTPDKTRVQVLEDVLVSAAKLCKGKPPKKPAKVEPSKKLPVKKDAKKKAVTKKTAKGR